MSICLFCKNQIGYSARATLECCRNDVHTRCLLVHYWDTNSKCPQCQENFYSEEIHSERETRRLNAEQIQRDDILEILEKDSNCAEEFEELVCNITETRDRFKTFQKKGMQFRKQFRKEIKSLTALLKHKENEYINKLKVSDPLKKWRLQSQKTKRFIRSFEEKYPTFPLKKAIHYRLEWNTPFYQILGLYFYSPRAHTGYFWIH